jgi:serine/threonine-protein kinase
MIGKTLSHYTIVEKLGAGGMGEVYKAHDERLDRDVAVKVLPSGTLADENARKRFRKEALALSKLNHPNIATVFDFDTQEGVDFIVMELVEGASLAEKLKTGALAEKEVSALGAQAADALEEAHERGIVHRDLKPGNIAVTPKGRVKVLDFGLARMLKPVSDEATTEALTEAHGIAGTLPYMSPEELRGERGDHRSDLYSLGVVLYEMATGRRPFEEKISTALANAIINRPPEPPSTHNRKVSPGLEGIILKALDKDTEHRYQYAREMRVDLERLRAPVSVAVPKRKPVRADRWLRAAGALAAALVLLVGLNVGGLRDRMLGEPSRKPIESLAVLPLENLSGDPEQEYFADGMTDAVINELAQIRALKVISRTSVMQYKDARKPLPEIARELNVEAVVEGSVLRAGGQVAITAQLIDASNDQHLWSKSYERELKDILTLRKEVARAIAQEIQVELTSLEEARLSQVRTVNADAYDAYLRGRFFFDRMSPENLRKAIQYYNEAIEIEPGFAPAYAGLAEVYGRQLGIVVLPPQEASSKCKAAAEKALEMDDTLVEAYVPLAWAKWLGDWDWSGGEEAFRRAIELNDGYALAHLWYGWFLTMMVSTEEGIFELKKALELDPVSHSTNLVLAYGYWFARQYDASIEQCKRALELNPTDANGHICLASPYRQKSMHKEAVTTVLEAIRIGGRQTRFLAHLGHSYAAAGEKTEALKIIDELKQIREQTYIDPGLIGIIYAGLGDVDGAMGWLEKAFEEHAYYLLWAKSPDFDGLRSDPRFQDILRRMNFPE